jgi:lipoyl(octanoyl) transferase
MPDWRLIPAAGSPAACGARNMAVDHALLHAVQRGAAPVLRLYRWEPPCLSLGRNQHAAGLYDEARLHTLGIDVVRRPTGGLAVLHDRELTYCVAVPADELGGPRAAYHLINRALVAGLRRLGVDAMVAGPAPAPDPRHDAAAPCFQAPAAGEVVAGGRKLVGSAQRCERRVLLQHGSVLLDGSQAAVVALQRQPVAAGPAAAGGPEAWAEARVARPAGPVTLRELLGRVPAWDELAAALAAGFEEACGIRLAPGGLTVEEETRAARLETTYADAAWTWRR